MSSGTLLRFARKLALLLLATLPLIHAPAEAADDPYESLLAAVVKRDLPTVRNLIVRGMDVDTVDKDGNTLLMLASRAGSEEVAAYLVEAGAGLDRRNRYGETSLMLAAINGRLQMCKMLIDNDAEFDHDGWNPLIYAATNGHDSIVALLLTLDVDIDAASDNGTTALMMAAGGGHLSTVKLLVRNGADLDRRNEARLTATQWALKHGHPEVAKALKDAGATR